MILYFVLPLYINNPCKTADSSILRIGNNPVDIAINSLKNKVYLATTDPEKNSANIAIIDCDTNTKTGDIPLPNNVHPRLATNNGIIYASNPSSNTISVIDGGSNKVLRDVTGINGHLAVNNQTNKIYVANAGSNTISVIDGKTDTLLRNEAKTGLHPTDIVVNSKTDRIYVANAGSNTISVIDGNSLKNIKNLAASEDVRINQFTNMTLDPKSAEFGLSISGEGNLFVVKATGQATIRVTLNWSLNSKETEG